MEQLLQLDGAILLMIQENMRTPWLSPIVTFITHLGDHGYLWIALVVILMLIPKTRKAGFLGAGALLLTFLITNVILKPWVARIRPYEVIEGLTTLVGKQSDFSFPSGHTANSLAVGYMLWLVSRKMGNISKQRETRLYFPKAAGWFVLILASLIGLSRLYVGVHYPTDVLCGAIIAIADASFVWWIYNKIQARK